MNEHLRDRILRRLDTLSDERGYQILDYVEFLESRYAERQSATSAFGRFTEAVEDKLRAGKVSASAIAETMNLMNRAANVLGGALAATQKMANELVNTPPSRSGTGSSPTTSSASAATTASTPADMTTPTTATATSTAASESMSREGAPASSTAGPIEAPGSPGEKL